VTGTTEGAITISDNAIYISATETSNGEKDSRLFKYDFILTAIKDYSIPEDIKMYPNPAKEYVTIEFEGLSSERVEILNSAGIKVIDKTILSGQSINISHLKTGIYTVRVQSRFLKIMKL
jgi:hypothetical protein